MAGEDDEMQDFHLHGPSGGMFFNPGNSMRFSC